MSQKETLESVMRFLDEDIQRIVEDLKMAIEDEHAPLVMGVKQSISM